MKIKIYFEYNNFFPARERKRKRERERKGEREKDRREKREDERDEGRASNVCRATKEIAS